MADPVFSGTQHDEGRLWLMVHTGSRGIGQAIRDHHVRSCIVGRTGLGHLDAREPAGRAYLDDMRWALAYAEENRRRIIAAAVEVVGEVVGAEVVRDTLVLCNHNYVERAETVAHSTSSMLRHAPQRLMTSVLYRPLIVSAWVLSYAHTHRLVSEGLKDIVTFHADGQVDR